MMCAEQHKLLQHHHHHQLLFKKNSIRDIDIPPRKLLTRRPAASDVSDEALLHKFLPYNNAAAADDDDDYGADPYSSDHFRMYEFKVRRCTRSRSHDWTDCPFAHPGEKARRRDPRRYHYSGTVCPDFRRGSCARGDNCEFAHGVFECWLHPARYRTEPCKDGTNCKRKVCFFAHSPRQLRILPTDSPTAAAAEEERKFLSPNSHCCVYCHSVSASPTSTLMSMSHFSPPVSPSLSPPLSPANNRSGYSPVSRFGDRLNPGGLSYKEALTELMSSLEGMNVNEASSSPGAGGGGGGVNRRNLAWVDVSFAEGDEQQQQQQQFVLSPSTPSPSGSSKQFLHFGDQFSSKGFFNIADHKANDSSNLACPDFGWVNDLLT